jgi:hypothetical protein
VSVGLSVNEAQIAAQLDAVLAREPQVRAVAIRSASRQDWPAVMTRRERRFDLRWCESRLALRDALLTLDADDTGEKDGLVLLTPLGDHEVPNDVIARLARGKVFQPQGWDIIRQLFAAQGTDARLGQHDWMPRVLVDVARQGPYAPVSTGFLDADTAWREVLKRCLQLDSARPDVATLLAWTMRPDVDVLLASLPDKARRDTLHWLTRHAGPTGEVTRRCIDAGRVADVLPLALVCGVVFARQGEGQQALAAAAVRLERYVGHQPVGVEQGRRWADDARQLMQGLAIESMRGAMDRADHILKDLHIAEFAHFSDLLPMGLEQRLGRFAAVLDVHVKRPTDASIAELEDAANSVLQHQMGAAHGLRMERVRMARRLARWWQRPPTAGNSDLDALAAQHADDGAYVDWARSKLLGGDELAVLSTAYATLRTSVQSRREASAKAFALALAQALKSAQGAGSRSVPLEDALERVVAPLARHHPVLLLVVDGLSVAIFRELFERCERHGWSELVRADATRPSLGLAVLPTVTTVSRTSLLAGRVVTGAAPLEKQAFASHAAMVQATAGKQRPRLFHKADLSEDGHLAGEVRQVIGDSTCKVVGVVYNAVDDHLSGPEQLQQRWNLEDLRLLLPVLREAQAARRIVVVTADHGHVLEDGSRQVGQADSDRWRPGSQATAPEEVLLAGHRVMTPSSEHSVVTLWSEMARYTGRKNGYHGGASPAEVVVPMSVLAPFGLEVPDWKPAPPQQPEWWDLPGAGVQAPAADTAKPVAKPASRRATGPAAVPQAALFSDEEVPMPAKAPPTSSPTMLSDWIGELLACPVYLSQRQLAARVALPDDHMRRLLSALDERGGKLGKAALAQRLALHEVRLAGVLSVARRLLNVDQAQVLTVDDAAGVIELNREMLQVQFQLGTAAARSGRSS